MTSDSDPNDKGWAAYDRMGGPGDEEDLTAEPAALDPDDEQIDTQAGDEPSGLANLMREIELLSDLPSLEYQRVRRPTAKRLQIGVRALDREIEAYQRTRELKEANADRTHVKSDDDEDTRWPSGFTMHPNGLFRNFMRNSPPVWLCDPIEVLGEGRDITGHDWCKWLRWKDGDGRLHTWPMPMRMLASNPGELEGEFLQRGLRLALDSEGKSLLRQALGGVRSRTRVTLVMQAGWHHPDGGPAAFMLPNGETCGTAAESLVLKSPRTRARGTASGTLEDWKKDVAAHVIGNHVPAFMLAAAFAGPLIDTLREPSGGFHFWGKSKSGKTLAMRIAVSAWRSSVDKGELHDWRTTANALEAVAEECSDGLLDLDEIHQAEPRDVVSAVYELANESGKQRLWRDTNPQQRRTWRSMILSNGEISIETVAAGVGKKVLPAGVEVRLPSIEIDAADMWSNLGNFSSRNELVAHLFRALKSNHGTPIRVFLNRLADARSESSTDLEASAQAMRDIFRRRLAPDADAQVHDVARRCALVATAGELATQWEILPWKKGEATMAAITVFGLWVAKRGNVQSGEENRHIDVIRAFLSKEGAGRFVRLGLTSDNKLFEIDPEQLVNNRAGWRRRLGPSEGHDEEFYVLPAIWREVCAAAGVSPTAVAKTLRDRKYLIPGDGNNLAEKHRIPGADDSRFYTVKSTILGGEDEPAAVPTVPTADY